MRVWNRKWEFAFGNGSSKIGVCFKLRSRLCGFFSHVGLTSAKARSLEDSCKEVGSCKHNTLIPLQRSTRTNSLDRKSATWKNNQSLDPVLYCKGTKASRQELTSLHESLQLPFYRPLRTVWDHCSRATVVDKQHILSISISHFRKQTPIFKKRNTDFQINLRCSFKASVHQYTAVLNNVYETMFAFKFGEFLIIPI